MLGLPLPSQEPSVGDLVVTTDASNDKLFRVTRVTSGGEQLLGYLGDRSWRHGKEYVELPRALPAAIQGGERQPRILRALLTAAGVVTSGSIWRRLSWYGQGAPQTTYQDVSVDWTDMADPRGTRLPTAEQWRQVEAASVPGYPFGAIVELSAGGVVGKPDRWVIGPLMRGESRVYANLYALGRQRDGYISTGTTGYTPGAGQHTQPDNVIATALSRDLQRYRLAADQRLTFLSVTSRGAYIDAMTNAGIPPYTKAPVTARTVSVRPYQDVLAPPQVHLEGNVPEYPVENERETAPREPHVVTLRTYRTRNGALVDTVPAGALEGLVLVERKLYHDEYDGPSYYVGTAWHLMGSTEHRYLSFQPETRYQLSGRDTKLSNLLKFVLRKLAPGVEWKISRGRGTGSSWVDVVGTGDDAAAVLALRAVGLSANRPEVSERWLHGQWEIPHALIHAADGYMEVPGASGRAPIVASRGAAAPPVAARKPAVPRAGTEAADTWESPLFGTVQVKVATGWNNVSATQVLRRGEVGSARWGYSVTDGRWARRDEPPPELVVELVAHGYGALFGRAASTPKTATPKTATPKTATPVVSYDPVFGSLKQRQAVEMYLVDRGVPAHRVGDALDGYIERLMAYIQGQAPESGRVVYVYPDRYDSFGGHKPPDFDLIGIVGRQVHRPHVLEPSGAWRVLVLPIGSNWSDAVQAITEARGL